MLERVPDTANGWRDTDNPDRGHFFWGDENTTAAQVEERWHPIDTEPGPPTTISKDAIWRRATNAEAELMEAALQAQPVRLRRIYEGATFISTQDELYGVLEAALVQLFGAERAAELLEPTGA